MLKICAGRGKNQFWYFLYDVDVSKKQSIVFTHSSSKNKNFPLRSADSREFFMISTRKSHLPNLVPRVFFGLPRRAPNQKRTWDEVVLSLTVLMRNELTNKCIAICVPETDLIRKEDDTDPWKRLHQHAIQYAHPPPLPATFSSYMSTMFSWVSEVRVKERLSRVFLTSAYYTLMDNSPIRSTGKLEYLNSI